MTIVQIDENFDYSCQEDKMLVASVGFFDGVHRGHRFLIDQVKKTAEMSGLPSAVITFSEHPRKVLQAGYQPELLTGFEEKLHRLATTGIDYCFVIEFTPKLSELSAEAFIQEKLRKKLNVGKLIIGFDHKFGKGSSEDAEDYKKYGAACGIEVTLAEQLHENEGDISSSAVRKILAEGKVKEAAKILSYYYSLDGKVISGNKMGREIGYPTANIEIGEKGKIIPKNGIYASRVTFDEKTYHGMTYIGNRPTISAGGKLRIETNLFGFSGNLYGKWLHIEFIEFIREDAQFNSVNELKIQLHSDNKEAEKILQHLIL